METLEYVRSHHNLRKNGYLHLQARILFVLSCFPIVPRECYFLARNVLCTKDNLVANYFGSVGKDLAQIAPSSMRKKGKVAGRGPQNGANPLWSRISKVGKVQKGMLLFSAERSLHKR